MSSKAPATLHTSGQDMSLDPTRLLISFREPKTLDDARQVLCKIGLVLEEERKPEKSENGRSMLVVNHSDTYVWATTQDGEPVSEETRKGLDELTSSAIINWAGPVYDTAGQHRLQDCVCPRPDVLLVKPTATRSWPRRSSPTGSRRYPKSPSISATSTTTGSPTPPRMRPSRCRRRWRKPRKSTTCCSRPCR